MREERLGTETAFDGLQETHRALPIALLRARETVMVRFRPILSEHGVTEQQWRVLRVLSESGPSDVSDVARSCCILLPSMTRIIRALEERGLITRRKDRGDGRRLVLAVTTAGTTLLGAVAPKSLQVYSDLLEKFGCERMEALLDLLESLAALDEAYGEG
ncbi:MAG: homoprotocatechuate degradation operon regulator HpaR [Pseudomonadota bacterium]